MRLFPAVVALLLSPAWVSAEPLTFRNLAGPTTGGGYVDGRHARFSAPHGIVTDSANSSIRRIAPDGTVSTLAGNGRPGSSDGVGADASFRQPLGLDLAPDGALIVADSDNARIRRVAMDGTVTTIAGTSPGETDGTLDVARFVHPNSVAVDQAGTIYVADYQAVRKIDSAGVTTLAGHVTEMGAVDGPGATARFHSVAALTLGPDGMLYVADYHNLRIRRATLSGDVSTVISLPQHPTALRFDTAGVLWIGTVGGLFRLTRTGVLTAVSFRGDLEPWTFTGVAFQPSGAALLADPTHHVIRRRSSTGELTTLAGSRVVRGRVDGPASVARFLGPVSLTADSHGNALVGDGGGIRKVAPSGFVTSLPYEYGCVGLAVDANDRIACSTGTGVWLLSPSGKTRLAGHDFQRGYADGQGSAARFAVAYGLAADAQGNIYVADIENHVVRRIDANGVVTTHAGTGIGGTRDGTRETAELWYPTDVAFDAAGSLYVLEDGSRIRRIAPDGTVTTLPCRLAGTQDCFQSGRRFARDVDGTFYVTSQFEHVVYRLIPDGDAEIVGGLPGVRGNVAGRGDQARFDELRGVAVTEDGRLVVLSSGSNTIHVAALPPVIDHFDAERTPAGTRLTWSAHYATAAAIDGAGAVPVSGSIVVAGSGPFRLTVTSEGGSVTATAGLGRGRPLRTR